MINCHVNVQYGCTFWTPTIGLYMDISVLYCCVTDGVVQQISGSTSRKYVFDVTFVGQRSPPWRCDSVRVEIKFQLECKLHFPSAQLIMHLTIVYESIEATYWVSWLSFDVQQAWIRAIQTAFNSSFCAVTVDPKSRWPHGKKAAVFPRSAKVFSRLCSL